jgi:hypothetical protein
LLPTVYGPTAVLLVAWYLGYVSREAAKALQQIAMALWAGRKFGM